MSGAEQNSPITEACRDVERACALLETPTTAQLDASSVALATAIGKLRTTTEGVTRKEAIRLRQAVTRAKTLLRYAGEYHSCWNRILLGMASNYTPYGMAEPLRLAPRISGEG